MSCEFKKEKKTQHPAYIFILRIFFCNGNVIFLILFGTLKLIFFLNFPQKKFCALILLFLSIKETNRTFPRVVIES